jgi:very-short-patch-repair endonuclease
MRLEPAALRVAANKRDEASAVAVLADVCRTRRTSAHRLADALVAMPRLPRRAFLAGVLADVADGVQSVLEHRYLRDVERAHKLPRGVRQGRAVHDDVVVYRDVEYLKGLLVIELDGSFHDPAEARWDDLERDVASAVNGARTVRLGWRQILDPCRTAWSVGRLLGALGWEGQPQGCPGCR